MGYRGEGAIAGKRVPERSVALLYATDPSLRTIDLVAGPHGLGIMLFAGKRINEPIVWHGPFVMSSKQELRDVVRKYQTGDFPPKRAPWDYRDSAAFPKTSSTL